MKLLRAARHAWRMTNPWQPMIRDSRGRIAPLYRIDRLLRHATGASELPTPVFERVRARLLAQTRAGMGSTPLALVSGAALYLGIYLWFLVRNTLPVSGFVGWMTLAGIALLLVSAWTYRFRVPRARREAIAAALLEERRCPSCAYDLVGTPADARGLVVCSECSAAWRPPDADPPAAAAP